jgi:hypothetical protein
MRPHCPAQPRCPVVPVPCLRRACCPAAPAPPRHAVDLPCRRPPPLCRAAAHRRAAITCAVSGPCLPRLALCRATLASSSQFGRVSILGFALTLVRR